ncbi:MAG: META domain-containing protein [Pseudomonadota bacterium]
MRVRAATLALLCLMLLLQACQLMPEGEEPADHELVCGERTLGYSLAGEKVRLHVDGEVRELVREESASGALYRDESGDTAFWSKGERVTVTHEGEELPLCQHADRMSLESPRWQVVSVEGESVPEEAGAVTLDFMPEGRVAGRSGCNHYTAAWEWVGDRLIIDRAASTRMACPSSVMKVEEHFLAALSRTEGARLEGDGDDTLVLFGREDKELIRATASPQEEAE